MLEIQGLFYFLFYGNSSPSFLRVTQWPERTLGLLTFHFGVRCEHVEKKNP